MGYKIKSIKGLELWEQLDITPERYAELSEALFTLSDGDYTPLAAMKELAYFARNDNEFAYCNYMYGQLVGTKTITFNHFKK